MLAWCGGALVAPVSRFASNPRHVSMFSARASASASVDRGHEQIMEDGDRSIVCAIR